MKKDSKVEFWGALISLFIAGGILVLPLLKINNQKYVYFSVFVIYGIINLGQYLMIQHKEDKKFFFTSLVFFVMALFNFFIDVLAKDKYLAFYIISLVGFLSLVRLKKMDFYHDRKSPMWMLEGIIFFILLFSGLLVTINLAYQKEVKILMIGCYLFLYSSLELLNSGLKLFVGKGE